ncbi:MAG: hypothetical protein ACRDKB_01250 [Actinomycetota bacterium]
MADPPRNLETDDDTGVGPDPGSTTGKPRSVKVAIVVVVLILVLLVVLLIAGGHGPPAGGH